MVRRRSLRTAVAVLACAAMAGCGTSTSLPGGGQVKIPASISVPTVSLPGVPGVDLNKVDPASAKKAICAASDFWLEADATTKDAIRPTVEEVINYYKTSPDQVTRDLAQAGAKLLASDSKQSAAQQQAAWQKLCGPA